MGRAPSGPGQRTYQPLIGVALSATVLFASSGAGTALKAAGIVLLTAVSIAVAVYVWRVLKVTDLRKKVLFTLGVIALYRLGSHIPLPYIDHAAVRQLTDTDSTSGTLALLNLFSGGALTRFSLFSLGIMPYITSSIIMQLLGVVIPRVEMWQKQGAVGQRKITQWTRYLTVALALLQATGLTFLFNNPDATAFFGGSAGIDLIKVYNLPRVAMIVLTITAGTALIMWLGELITQKGIGNGMSVLIFSSVISRLPAEGSNVRAQAGWGWFIGIMILALFLIFAIIYMELGQRRITVQYAKRVVGRRQYGGGSTYIPLKVNQAGVIPIIFASSVLYLPTLLTTILPADGFWGDVSGWLDRNLVSHTSLWNMAFLAVLIIFFAYFYTAISFDPQTQADNIRKQGGYIPGIRPGPPTVQYLKKVLDRITLPGALAIAVIALLPQIVFKLKDLQNFPFGGTSILIAVGVGLETVKQIDSQLMMRNYEGFLK